MCYRYFICDVFTEVRFGGNPLAVLPDAAGLSDGQMQQIAREFNFSETAFVLPPESGHTRRVRIFTPTQEVPFAGHPNIGTAFTLANSGELGDFGASTQVIFEEKAGLVAIALQRRAGGSIWCELEAPEPLSIGEPTPPELVAGAVSLSADDIVTRTHAPRTVSVGLPFTMAELVDRAALGRARIRWEGFDALVAAGIHPDIHLYVRSGDAFDLRARLFAPLDGVPEDPATGSANCALAGLLAHHDPAPDTSLRWRIAQGVEMGRPSVLDARAEKRAGRVIGTFIGGCAARVAEGLLEVG
jgi:trans-2,3-dihydro-3-hydroxyanthranilate isomerase